MNDFQETAIAIWLRTIFTMWTLTLLYLWTALIRFNHPQRWQILIGRYKHLLMCRLQMASIFLVNYIDYKYSKFQMLIMLLRASKSICFINLSQLYSPLSIYTNNQSGMSKCLKQFYDVNMYFLSNGNYISNWKLFLKTNIA